MNHMCHSKTRVRYITLSLYTSFNSWKHSVGFFFFFNLTRNFRLIRCLIFILVKNPPEQHNMATLKQSSEVNQLTQRRVQSCSIWEGSRSIIFHLLPTATSFTSTVRAFPLFYSHITAPCWAPPYRIKVKLAIFLHSESFWPNLLLWWGTALLQYCMCIVQLAKHCIFQH
jgi:hypothetical protein